MSTTQPSVLAGLDSLPDSLTAVEAAAVEASRRHLPLRLVMCGAAARGRRPSAWRPSFYPLNRFEQVLVRVARRFPALEIIAEIYPGDLSDLLVDESGEASLVVVGPSHTGGFDRSSNHWLTHRVVTHARCPVLVARAGVGTDHLPVVVGVDSGVHSTAAVRIAFPEAALRHVTLRAVHMYPPGPGGAAAARAAAEEALLADATARWLDEYPDVKVQPGPTAAEDVAHALMCAAAEAELVVVGSRVDLGTDLLLGPATRALVERSPCAVLVAR